MSDVLTDNYDIGRLLSRYNDTVDDLNFAGWADCFAQGGVFDGAYQSFSLPDDLQKFKDMSLGIMNEAPNIRHFTTNLVVDIVGDTARAKSFLLLVSTPEAREDGTIPNSRILQVGTYFDDLVRINGQWKIKLRRVKIDGAPAANKPTWTAEG